MTALSPDVIRAALTAVTGLVPRHATILPPASDDPADYEAPPQDPRHPSATNRCAWPVWIPDEPLPDHDPLDDAEGT